MYGCPFFFVRSSFAKAELLRPHRLSGFLHDGGRTSGRPRCEGTRYEDGFPVFPRRPTPRPTTLERRTPSTDDVPRSHVLVPDKDVPPSQYRRLVSSLGTKPTNDPLSSRPPPNSTAFQLVD